MISPLEIAANGVNTLSILLAGLNSVHTWWTGILGCVLFGWLFFGNQLYADVTLQAFFVVTSAIGWWTWRGGERGPAPVVRHAGRGELVSGSAVALVAAAGYGWVLHRFTDAYAPLADSVVLCFSVLAQLLLMRRRYESWWMWLLVNSVAMPLYLSRGLRLTALLYLAYWINAVVALIRWRTWVRVG